MTMERKLMQKMLLIMVVIMLVKLVMMRTKHRLSPLGLSRAPQLQLKTVLYSSEKNLKNNTELQLKIFIVAKSLLFVRITFGIAVIPAA